MAAKYKVPRGTYDILPDISDKWIYLENMFKKLALSYDYKLIVTPIFESSDLFERSVGDTSDIVEKEMYKFQDKKGRMFALRPEGTAPVVRSYVENNLGVGNSIVRLMYHGPMFRYDRPQKGRYRQFYQYGVEAIGSNHPYIDAEVIALAYSFLNQLGLSNFNLEINNIGCPVCSKDYDKALVEYFEQYTEDLCPDCRKRLHKNPKRLLDCKVKTCKIIGEKAPVITDYLDDECRTHFEAVQGYLSKMGIPFEVNPRIVRGLDYYTGTAFEIINKGLKTQNALLGGGRYNSLTEQVGGKPQPGIGFAGGFERLINALEEENLKLPFENLPDIYIIDLGENAQSVVPGLIMNLRNNGLHVGYDIDKTSMKAQMKAADRSGAGCVIIIGDEELENNVVNIKNMKSRTQKQIRLDEVMELSNKSFAELMAELAGLQEK